MERGEQIGRYRVDRRLGAGAFGTVWLAHDEVLAAPVAVKVMAENWIDRLDIRERFLAEARLLRQADSNRVIQVFDIGELPDGRPYFVMEYADAGSLEDRLAHGPLPLAEALRLTARAARGAAALHAAGIVHRDIKPSNVLLRTSPDAEGGPHRVLLADLGLAKSLAHASGLTMAAGSAGYQPPEQAEPGMGIDARADVYSLGALGYHLVTGAVPGSPGKVVRPAELRPGLPQDVQRALLRAMEPDRERRWPTAKDLAGELDRLADRLAEGPADRPAPPAAASRRRPRPLLLAAAAAGLAAAAAGTVTAWAVGHQDGGGGTRLVRDATGRVSAEVPAQWAGQLRDSGWDPEALGLAAGTEPGFAIADDLSAWQDLGSPVNGLFVGLSEQDGDVAAEVAALAHEDCHYDGSREHAGANWRGTVRRWSSCPGEGGTLTEAALAPEEGEEPQVYVQIRQSGGSDATDRILSSLDVAR
ncbi:serine/threonine-protein kinase [Streptomyces hoynatensis]|uniref:non-specific serine/threonine protein kinase n=1 Tax=Streptomyces hoynatensis TaxID=1141874 RepID=A0A3A9ZEB5_9ACTN|nr:serine/threonine-protein kinase [Streptomyces hoynatensis]RKN46700.1 serine/threonine protein kinase [Streptomyces hoynatensis]